MTFSKELKDAISHLSSTEKDKLILRLLKKDIKLANRLHFELVSDLSVDEMRDILQEKINLHTDTYVKNFSGPYYLLSDIRSVSAWITEHVFTTKDKFGEVYLTLYMLNCFLSKLENELKISRSYDLQKLYVNIASRLFKTMTLTLKIHEDFYSELSPEFDKIKEAIIDNNYFMNVCVKNGLDIKWLSPYDIPENIADIQKDIRSKGFLR